MVRQKRDSRDDEAVERGPSESVWQNEESAEQESRAFDLTREFCQVLPDFWEQDLEAALEEVQQVVNHELGRQFVQLVESLRDFFYELFNYPLERPWPDSLAIFAEDLTDRGLKLTPRTLEAIGQLIAEELAELENVFDADSIDASAAAGPTAGVDDETEPAERTTASEQSKGQIQSDANEASRAAPEARYNREQQPAAAID